MFTGLEEDVMRDWLPWRKGAKCLVALEEEYIGYSCPGGRLPRFGCSEGRGYERLVALEEGRLVFGCTGRKGWLHWRKGT